jgi:hypothetical protein
MSELHEVIENGFYGDSDVKRTLLSMATYIEALEKRVAELEHPPVVFRPPPENLRPQVDDIGML